MNKKYKMYWVPEGTLAFDPDHMKIVYRLGSPRGVVDGVGEVMLSRSHHKVAIEIVHTSWISETDLQTTKYSLSPRLVSKIKRAKSEAGEEFLFLDAADISKPA